MNIETVGRLTIRPETKVIEAGKECVAALSRRNTRPNQTWGETLREITVRSEGPRIAPGENIPIKPHGPLIRPQGTGSLTFPLHLEREAE